MKFALRFTRFGNCLLGLCLSMGVAGPILTPTKAASSERHALRKFKGPYQGGWTRGGTPLPLIVRMPKAGKGIGRGWFEATPCDSSDGLSPLVVKVKKYQLTRNGKRLVSRGRATWSRSKIPQLGGPNPSGPLKLTAVLRGNKPSAKGKMKIGKLTGPVKVGNRGKIPKVPKPWMEMVMVGNPGNPGIFEDIGGFFALFGLETVDFKIGKYEVTNAQYVEFLNAVAKTDTHGLFSSAMETNAKGGIAQSGSAPS